MLRDAYLKYYALEQYLFEDVSKRFCANGEVTVFDFFCIVIWKANRSKTRIAKRLLNKGFRNLDEAVANLTREILDSASHKRRLEILLREWGFQLPIASAVLTVFYPSDFTVYDVRVCGELGAFEQLKDLSNFDSQWAGYCSYVEAVKASTPAALSLRDKDRWLWGRSFSNQLMSDIARNFVKAAKP